MCIVRMNGVEENRASIEYDGGHLEQSTNELAGIYAATIAKGIPTGTFMDLVVEININRSRGRGKISRSRTVSIQGTAGVD